MKQLKNRITIFCGHYGSGKTNIAVNLAIKDTSHKEVVLADLDIVNPYFRAADNKNLLLSNNVSPLIPEFANTNIDIPSIPGRLNEVISLNSSSRVYIDVGGDAGSVILGTYSNEIISSGYDMIYVLNLRRPLTKFKEEIKNNINEIESLSKLKINYIINNTNLGPDTDNNTFLDSIIHSFKISNFLNLPLLCHSYVDTYLPDFEDSVKDTEFSNLNYLKLLDITKKIF